MENSHFPLSSLRYTRKRIPTLVSFNIVKYRVSKSPSALVEIRLYPAEAHFSGCSSTTNAHSETGQMEVFCQNLPLGALSSRSAPSFPVGELFKKFGLYLNTGVCLSASHSE